MRCLPTRMIQRVGGCPVSGAAVQPRRRCCSLRRPELPGRGLGVYGDGGTRTTGEFGPVGGEGPGNIFDGVGPASITGDGGGGGGGEFT